MSRKILFSLITLVLLVTVFIIFGVSANYYSHLSERLSQHETILLGQNRLAPGSQAGLRVLVRDSRDGSPLPDAQIKVTLKEDEGSQGTIVFTGRTNADGSADINFPIPPDAMPNQLLVVETQSKLGSDTISRPVTITRDYSVLLTTDKPIYQPGQVIHMRALALSTFDLSPAKGQSLEINIADGKGNKVFRKLLTTSDYGVASTDFQLASAVNGGDYKITAQLGNVSSEKTVNVEFYVLPKFKVVLTTERSFYQPGQHVQGTLNAQYFFGKPVNNANIQIEGYTFDVQRQVTANLQGISDDQGNFTFEFDLPAYIAGTDLEGGQARYYLQASVIDQAQHTEISNLSLPIAGSALLINAVPEGGFIRPGLDNILYVLTTYPDGRATSTKLWITFQTEGTEQQIETGEHGMAEVHFTPTNAYEQISITAQDEQGTTTQQTFSFEGTYPEETILLRPDKPIYRVGNTMNLTILTTQPSGTVYLDIIRQGQTVSTRSVAMEAGHAEVAVDLTPDLFGTLELHAYKILRSGNITRDTRLVVVDQAEGLVVNLKPGQESYKPGDNASIDLNVQDFTGKGVQSAIGLSIVDESVFALAESDPGFARLYFLLEKEILTPRYDIHGFNVRTVFEEGGVPTNQPELRQSVDNAAQASLAEVVRSRGQTDAMASFTLQGNSHNDAMQRADTLRAKFFTGASGFMLIIVILIPLAVIVIAVYSNWRDRTLTASLAILFGLTLLLVLAFFLWPLGENAQWVSSSLERLGYIIEQSISAGGIILLAILALSGLVGFFCLVGISIAKKDLLLGWMLLLIVPYIIAAGLYAYTYGSSNSSSETGPILLALTFFFLPLGFLLRFGGFASARRTFAAIATLPVGLFLLVGLLPAILLASMSPGMGAAGAPVPAGILNERDFAVDKGLQFVPVPTMAVEAAGVVEDMKPEEAQTGSAAQPPRLRQYFPETMLWLPDEVTDDKGYLNVALTAADSITTWRMTVLASSQDGKLGSTTGPLVVFQDFFIDIDLPIALTVGDEIAVPVGVFNYLKEPQTVKLELEQADWFEMVDEPGKEMTIAANDISVVYFRIRAVKFGQQPFKVTALGSKMSDAILKQVRVYADGKPIATSVSDQMTSDKPIIQKINIPQEAIPGTQTMLVKVYPGVVSQVIEGLDSILRMPYGCFEQTSSTTYPNVLVMDYLAATGKASPEVQMKAEEYINLGYQRLTTFEVGSTGGFSLFGDSPADRMLTAYGLQEFSDMARVHEVDPAFIKRAAEWLLSQQTSDGSWENDRGLVHESTWSSLQNDRLPVTAYIVWSLIEAGFLDDSRTQAGLQYIREYQNQAEDPYVIALVANALVAADTKGKTGSPSLNDTTISLLERLAAKVQREGDGAFWNSGIATFMGAQGQTGSIETTALAAYAFGRSASYADLANASLIYLIRQKDSSGTWYTTQATVLTLKALIQSVRSGSEQTNATIKITLNNGQTRTVQVTPETFDVVQMVSFDDINIGRENQVVLDVQGQGNLMYQITTNYYLPWETLTNYPEIVPQEDQVKIDVSYDRTELSVNDFVTVNVTVSLTTPGGSAQSVLIDLGLPPGFTLQSEDLNALVTRFKDVPPDYADPMVKRYETTGRQILVYIQNLAEGKSLQFSYRLLAKFPLQAKAPASNVYDYYNPEVNGEDLPQMLVVTGKSE